MNGYKRVSKEYAESYQWWEEFLNARTQAIDSMTQLGKTDAEIYNALNFSDKDHIYRIKYVSGIKD